MELNRRNFILSLVGGAVGTQLTPLPWKLTDDLAIWTQNWPWVPVPKEGKFTYAKSVCNLCPGGCGINVRKVDNRAVKIEGRTDYPVNPGGICPLGMGGLQLLYDESIRHTGPMIRVGPRGSGIFKDITWSDAINMLAKRISSLRKEGRPEAVVAVDGNRAESTMAVIIERFLQAIGSPNYVRIPSMEDTYRMANSLMMGNDYPMAYDLENADYILSFGSGLLDGWGAPGRVINAWSMWRSKPLKGKVQIIQIESRASNTASKADDWIAPKPGTEAALALGMAHVIIKEGLYDNKFIDNHSFGFYDWRSDDGAGHKGFKTMVLDRYTPAKVARITGLKANRIVSLAKSFSTANAPVAICGKGKGLLNGSLFEFMAVQGLNALVGNINKPGGVFIQKPLPLSMLPKIEEDRVTINGLKKPRLDMAGNAEAPFAHSLINNLSRAIIESPAPPLVDTILVFSSNPAFTLPDGGAFKKALKKVPFIVSFSPFQDETSCMADLVLPDHTYLEKIEDVIWPATLQFPLYGLSQPVVKPVYATKNTGDVIIQLAKQIGQSVKASFPWRKFEDILKARAKGLFDSGGGLVRYDDSTPVWEQKGGNSNPRPYKNFNTMWKKIKNKGMWYRPASVDRNFKGLFNTPSGKFEFFSSKIESAVKTGSGDITINKTLANMGIEVKGDEAFMPHYERNSVGAHSSAYPLLMVPYEMINLSSGWLPSPPFLYKTLFDNQLLKNESFAEINPKTASKFGLKEGDRAYIESPSGRVRVRVALSECAMPDVVYLPSGLGHTAYDEFLKGKGVNPNDIIHAGKDPGSGYPAWWSTPVKLIKV